MNIAFVTLFRQVHACSEYANSLSSALISLDHKVFILAPEPGEIPLVPGHESAEFRFDPKSLDVPRMMEFLVENNIERLFVQLDGIPDLFNLKIFVQDAARLGIITYAILHSSKYLEFDYGVFNVCLLPNPDFKKLPPNYRLIKHFDQGMPPRLDFDRNAYRQVNGLPRIIEEENAPTGFIISAVDGRQDLQKVIDAIAYLNQYKSCGKEISLLIHSSADKDSERAQELMNMANEIDFVYLSIGYIYEQQLVELIHASDAFIAIYPTVQEPQTSSLLRVALASGTPILTNKGNHSKDLIRFIPNMLDSDDVSVIVQGISNVLNYSEAKRRVQNSLSNMAFEQLAWTTLTKNLLA